MASIPAICSIHLLDIGCVKVLPRRVRDALRASARALVAKDRAANLEALRDLGLYRDGLDPGPALVWSRFTHRPLLAGESKDGVGDEHAIALYQQLGELTRHGYAQIAPHTFFLLRAFMGLDGIFRRLPHVNGNGNGHDHTGERVIPLFEELIAAGDQARADLELDGYLRLR